MAEPQGKLPNVLTPTADLPREEWLAYRRQGIGGSDAAAVLGISPFRTGLDLYYDKLGQPVEDDEQNWVAKEVGTLLEDLVARIFTKKTGLEVCPMPVMFQHPDHPWMLADVDRLVKLPDGNTAVLECKTTNYNARDKWEYDGKPIVPQYYEAQGRHYMAVMNLSRVYFCCLYGNSEDDVIIRSIDRDLKYEGYMKPVCSEGSTRAVLVYWIASFSALPALNTGSLAAGISTGSFVLGLRPVRAARFFISKEPKPTSCTLSSAFNASVTASVRAPSAASQSFLDRPDLSAMADTNSILFM